MEVQSQNKTSVYATKQAARVLVAAPFVLGSTSSEHVLAWKNAVLDEALQNPNDTFVFAICCSTDDIEPKTVDSYDIFVPGVTVLAVRRPNNSARVNSAGQILERVRLTRKATEDQMDLIWFLDLNIRPPIGGWASMREEISLQAGAVLIPYPLQPLAGTPGVVISGTVTNSCGDIKKTLIMVDSWTCMPETGRASFPVVGGGFGCTLIPIYTFAVVQYSVATHNAIIVCSSNGLEQTNLSGEALGWFLNALKAKVPIRAIAGAVCTVVA